MPIKEDIRKADKAAGMVYPRLRKAQLRLTRGDRIKNLSEFSERETFRLYAEKTAAMYFPKSFKKNLTVTGELIRLYTIWFILSPLIRGRRGIIHHDWHISHALTWCRQVCSQTTRQWWYTTFVAEPVSDPAGQCVRNCAEILGIHDVHWLEDTFSFLSVQARADGKRGDLARHIMMPFLYINKDEEKNRLLDWKARGKKKELNRMAKKGSASYVRYHDRGFVFASDHKMRQCEDHFEWTDIREKPADFFRFEIGYSYGIVEKNGKKVLKGGLNIKLSPGSLRETADRARLIARNTDNTPHRRLYLINNLVRNFIMDNKYARGAGIQFNDLHKRIKGIVRKNIAPSAGPGILEKLYSLGISSIDPGLHFVRGNPYWDTEKPEEPVFQLWWNPHKESFRDVTDLSIS